MSDQERLEKLNNLLERYYAAENSFEQTDLAISIIQGHVDWLIKQAMRAIEGEEELDRWLSGRNVAVSTYGEIRGLNEENARLRETLEFYADHSNWHEENTGSPYLPYYESDASRDGGDKARIALGHPE